MKIGLFNLSESDVDSSFKLMKKVLKHALKILDIKDVEFNVIIVNNDYIHNLNRDYRKIDRETDVITFALEDDKTFNPQKRILGDVYISIDKANSQSIEYGHSLNRELCFLAVHGLLHLLGYDHMKKDEEEIMFNLQEKILDEMDVKR